METLNNQISEPVPPVSDIDPTPTPINPVPMTNQPLGMPGFSLDTGLAERVNQSSKIGRGFNIKLTIITVLVLLFLGGGAYAWFFTDLKYNLPFLKTAVNTNNSNINEANNAMLVNVDVVEDTIDNATSTDSLKVDYADRENWALLLACYFYDNSQDEQYLPAGELRSLFSFNIDEESGELFSFDQCSIKFGQEAYNYVSARLRVDNDEDGLNLMFEDYFYASDNNKDTDKDGFTDGDEVKNGYNPNGDGKLGDDISKNIKSNIIYPKVSASDWVKGDSKASVTLIIYSDADCPYCSRFHETANQALKDYSGKLKVVYRHFPLTQLHPEAAKKAEAIECVGELAGNNKVWEFLDKLFVSNKPTLAQLGDTLTSLDIDKDKFQTCLDSGKYADKINTQSADAQTAGAQGTPYSLLIKGEQVTKINGAYPYDEIKKLIDNYIK